MLSERTRGCGDGAFEAKQSHIRLTLLQNASKDLEREPFANVTSKLLNPTNSDSNQLLSNGEAQMPLIGYSCIGTLG